MAASTVKESSSNNTSNAVSSTSILLLLFILFSYIGLVYTERHLGYASLRARDGDDEDDEDQILVGKGAGSDEDYRFRTTPWRLPGFQSMKAETSSKFNARFMSWRENANRYLNGDKTKRNFRYSPYGVQLPPGDGLHIFLRTAIVSSPTLLVMVPYKVPRNELNVVGIQDFLNNGCKVQDANGEQQDCTCHCATTSDHEHDSGGDTRILKIVCTTTKPISLNAKLVKLGAPTAEMIIPIDEIVKQVEDLHVCVQNVYSRDDPADSAPVELFEQFIGHYARLGAKHIHFYTRGDEDVISFYHSIRTPKSFTIWIHDSPFPADGPQAEQVLLLGNRFQTFIGNDCMTRAHAMGARWTIVSDWSEFAFPRDKSLVSLAQALDPLPLDKKVFWMNNKEYVTSTCLPDRQGNKPDSYHNFLEHMVFSAIDLPKNRFKGVARTGEMTGEFLANMLWFTHSMVGADDWKTSPGNEASAYPNPREPFEMALPNPNVIVQHYRAAWRDGCSKLAKESDPLPANYEINRPSSSLIPINDMFE